MEVQILIPFFIYLLVLLVVSLYTSRNQPKGMDGFFLGGRKMSPFIISVSSAVASRGSWLLLGFTTQAYIMGLPAIWMAVGFVLSEFLVFLFLGPAICKYSADHNCHTLTDVIVSRFKDENHSLRIVISLALLTFLISFVTSQLAGGSRALYAFLGLSATNGIIITGVIVFLFVFFGGFKTLSYSDVLHAFIILVVLVGLPVIMFARKEGFEEIHADILLVHPEFFNLKTLSFGALLGFFSIGLGSPGNAQVLVKFMSVNKPAMFPRMTLVNVTTNILMVSGALFIGLYARVYFPEADSIPGADAQNVYIGLAGEILPPLLLGVVMVSVFAAVLSVAGSQVLVAASTVINDLYKKTFNPYMELSEATLILYSRISVVVLIYLAILAGTIIETDFSEFVLFGWAGLGASIGPAIISTFIWKDTTRGGIKAGVITGAFTVIVWKNLPFLSDLMYELIPAFILASLAIWVGSKVDKKLMLRKYNRKARYEDIKRDPFLG